MTNYRLGRLFINAGNFIELIHQCLIGNQDSIQALCNGFNLTFKMCNGVHHYFELKTVMGFKKTLNGAQQFGNFLLKASLGTLFNVFNF